MASSLVDDLDISQLPSVKEGMSAEEEALKRLKTCRFIEEAGTRTLKLPRVAVSTAMVFFHRFYAKHSFQEHDRFEVAVASIVLAAKTEESPKKLDTVLLECYKLKSRGLQAGRISAQQRNNNNGNTSLAPDPSVMDKKREEFMKLKERVLLLERVILHTIGFELSIDHPYKFFIEQIKMLIHHRQLKYKNPETKSGLSTGQTMSRMLNELVQYSMSFANDSMHTSLCLQFTPQQIATSCVYLACQFSKVEPVSGSDWRKVLGDPDIDALASISIQVMDLVAQKKASDTDLFKQIRAQLKLLQSREKETTGGRTKSPIPPPPPSGPSAKRPRVG